MLFSNNFLYFCQVMVLVSSRGYILDVWVDFGGNGKCNDASIWNQIMSNAEAELKDDEISDDSADDISDEDKHNILTFFNSDEDCILVDRGFRDAEGGRFVLISPRSKPKGDNQQSAINADYTRFVTKLRNVVERINKVALKNWDLLGGKPLHWRHFCRLGDTVKIAAALWNCYHGCLDAERSEWDESDFKVLQKVHNPRNTRFVSSTLQQL